MGLRQAVSFMKHLDNWSKMHFSSYLMHLVFYSGLASPKPQSLPDMVAVSETLRVITVYNYWIMTSWIEFQLVMSHLRWEWGMYVFSNSCNPPSHAVTLISGWKPLSVYDHFIFRSCPKYAFLAPTGAQGVTMSVCPEKSIQNAIKEIDRYTRKEHSESTQR